MQPAVLPILLFCCAAAAFGVALLIIGNVVNPRRWGRVKQMPYESGMDPIHDTRRRFDVHFHLVAIAFLIFDAELLFLYPWAVVLGHSSSEPAAASAAQRLAASAAQRPAGSVIDREGTAAGDSAAGATQAAAGATQAVVGATQAAVGATHAAAGAPQAAVGATQAAAGATQAAVGATQAAAGATQAAVGATQAAAGGDPVVRPQPNASSWAVRPVFAGGMVFLLILTLGFVYDWRKRVFQWR